MLLCNSDDFLLDMISDLSVVVLQPVVSQSNGVDIVVFLRELGLDVFIDSHLRSCRCSHSILPALDGLVPSQELDSARLSSLTHSEPQQELHVWYTFKIFLLIKYKQSQCYNIIISYLFRSPLCYHFTSALLLKFLKG